MSQPQVCTVDDGLINPAMLPAKSADLDTTKITGAADDLRSMGSTVDSRTDEIKTTWGGLTGCYEAPEQAEVYALMNDPATASEDVKDTFGKMAGYLDTYAAELETIKPKLADFEKRAQAFRDEVIDGVWVNATEASDAGLGDYAKAVGNWFVGNDQERKKVPWYEDGDTVAKNEAFVKEIGGIYATVSAAAATCATGINGLTSLPAEEKKVEGIPEAAFYDPASPMPWGSPREEDRNCPESVGHGAYQFGKNTVEGLGQLISYNPETGKWGDWGHAGQTWMGTGNVLLSLAVTGIGTVGFTQLMKATGNGDNPVVQWLDERHQVASTVVTGLVGIDLNADDPFHRWKEDGVATFTESFLNVGTMFIPGAGQAGAAVKVAGLGSKLARVTGAVADFAVPGGSWLVKGGTHTIPVLRNVVRFGDGIPVNALDDAVRVGGKAPTINPVSVVDDLQPAGAARPARPVTNGMFGDGPPPGVLDPHGSPGARPAPEQPAVRPEPEAARPEPEAARPEPEAARPEPEAARPEPEAARPEPEPARPEPEPQEPVNPPEPRPETVAEPTHSDIDADARPADPDGTQPPRPDHPDGGPAKDPHGREYIFDADGRRHLPDDPQGTYRDRNGALHGEKNLYATDPNKPDADLPLEKAEKGTPQDFAVSDAERAAHDARVEARDQAVVLRDEAAGRLSRLIESTGINPKVLDGSKLEVANRLRDLVDDGTLTVKQGQSLTNAVVNDRVSRQMLNSVSERLGDKAAAAVARMRQETTLIRSGGAGSGRFDQVTIGENPPTLKFYEAKGGNAQLGERTVDGVRRQQGTAAYLNDVLQADPRLLDEVRTYIDEHPHSPVSKLLANGSIRIEYDLVQALPGGRIKVTPFVLDRSAVTLPDFK